VEARQVIEAWYAGYVGSPEDLRALADGAAPMPEWMSEDVVIDNLDEIPGHFEGHDGVRRWARETFAIFDDGHMELQELIQVKPDALVSVALIRGRMRETGIDPKFPFSVVHGFRDRRLAYGKGFIDREAAIEFAGGWPHQT
jgi:ketosteroid isomerase-like protein